MSMPLQPDDAIDSISYEGKKHASKSKTALILGVIAFLSEFAAMGIAVWAVLQRPPLLKNETFLVGVGLAIMLAAVLAFIGFLMAFIEFMKPAKRTNRTIAALIVNFLYLLSVAALYILGSNS